MSRALRLTYIVLVIGIFASSPSQAGILDTCSKYFQADFIGSAYLLPGKTMLTMYRYFGTTESYRSGEGLETVYKYKASMEDSSDARTLNLDDMKLTDRSPILGRVYSHYLKYAAYNAERLGPKGFNLISEYALQVMLLRTGDSITASGRTYKLGEFLGAGNATHIYRLAYDPSKVIRIPFYALGDARNSGRRFMKTYIELYGQIPDGLPHVRLHQHGDRYSYAIMDYVETNGMNGMTYINSDAHLTDPNFERKRQRLMHLSNMFNHSHIRQFAWSTQRNDWILLDWE